MVDRFCGLEHSSCYMTYKGFRKLSLDSKMVNFKQDRAIYLQMAERICDEILAGKYHSR